VHRRRYERRLRNRVRRERGCLSTLDHTTRTLLGLRAGLDGPAQSRGSAAARLGLTRRAAARLEHQGLRDLHAACGSVGSGGSAPGPASARVAALAGSAPVLQNASYLPVATAPELRPVADMGGRRGQQGVKGASASSSPPSPSQSKSVPATVETGAIGGQHDSGQAGLWVAVAAMIAALVALLLVGLRRRAVAVERGPRDVAAPPPAAPAPPAPVEAPAASTAAMTAAPAAAAAPAPDAPPATPAAATAAAPATPAPTQAPVDAPPAPEAAEPRPSATTRVRPRDPRRLASIAARELKKRRGR
jgi:hypothetical protein